jgi:hypothetical protein
MARHGRRGRIAATFRRRPAALRPRLVELPADRCGPEAHDSRFSFVGENLRDPHWPTFERQRVGECVEHTLLHCATSFLDRVLTERASVAEGIGTHRGTPVLYRSILLPLSEDGSRVDGVLGATNYRDVA